MTVSDEAPSTFRRIFRELPRKKVALVVLVVVVNLAVVMYLRGRAIGQDREHDRAYWAAVAERNGSIGHAPRPRTARELERPSHFVAPWEWTSDEWRDTVWPGK